MKWGVALNVRDRVSETLRKAEAADRGAIDQIWVTDFPSVRYAPAIAAAIAERTQKCRIGVGLISPLLYSSTQISQFMSTLIDTYGDRFDLLIGPGDRSALARVGISYSTKQMVEYTASALDKIKSNLSKAGYECSVFLGAQGPVMIKRSLRADGVLLNFSDIEMLQWALNQMEEVPTDFGLGVFPPTYIGDCKDIMDNQGIVLSAAMVATGLNRKVSETFGFRDKINTARNLLKKKGRIDMDIANSIGRDVLKRFALCMVSDQLQEYLKTIERMGISSIVFGPPQGIREKGVDLLVEAKQQR
jgi:hypothetical protein